MGSPRKAFGGGVSPDDLSTVAAANLSSPSAHRCKLNLPLFLMVAVCASVIQVVGCGQSTIRPLKEHVPAAVPKSWDTADFSRVLRENVRDGLVDYRHLAEHRDPLDRFLGLLSVGGPERTPALFNTRGDRAAYWINAYNAMILRVALEQYPTSTLYDLALPDPESDFFFPLDGVVLNARQVRERIDSETGGDVRTLFALCGGTRASPPLASEPYRGFDLDRRLAEATASAVSNPGLVRVDHVDRRLLVWLELYTRRHQVVESYERRYQTRGATLLTVLNNWAGRSRRGVLASARGYRIAPIPFDRRLNDASKPSASSAAIAAKKPGDK